MSKIRILALCDSPTVATGFAQVSRNVLNGLHKTGKYEIEVMGINYFGDYYDREKFPYAIYPAMPQGWQDMYGRDRVMAALSGAQAQYGLTGPWDIIFTIQDPFVMEGLGTNYNFAEQIRLTAEMWKRVVPPEQWYKWIGYWPVDAEIKENWVTRSMCMPHYPVAYCNWGRERILKWDRGDLGINFNLKIQESDARRPGRLPVSPIKDRIRVIHHGVDLDVFKPLSREEKLKFRKEYFNGKLAEDTFLVVNISRNQPRKDIQRTIAVFAEFKKRVKKAHLYLHMKGNDAGGSVDEMCRNFNLVPGEDYSMPDEFQPGVGFQVEVVNQIYNAADICITTTLGEGWGFITTEAMATKTPVVAPNITSILDIFNSHAYDYTVAGLESSELRGIPVKAGSTNSEWVCLGLEDNERIRPLTNVDDMVEKMHWAYLNRDKVQRIVDRAYEWVTTQSWENKIAEWDTVFTEAYKELQLERELGDAIDKLSRNDPCPCGSGEKFKKCHGLKLAEERTKYDELFGPIKGMRIGQPATPPSPTLPSKQTPLRHESSQASRSGGE